jgi:hypothetical protein
MQTFRPAAAWEKRLMPRRHAISVGLPLRERRFFTPKVGRGGRSVKTTLAAAVLAVALAATPSNDALAWAPGDIIGHIQSAWGDAGQPAGALLMAHYDNVYAATFGLFEIGIPGSTGFTIIFTDRTYLVQYLPDFAGPIGPLAADLIDPERPFGEFSGQIAGLKLNVDFSDAGLLQGDIAVPYGDLVIQNVPAPFELWNGMSVRQVLAEANVRLGGGTGTLTRLRTYIFSSVN